MCIISIYNLPVAVFSWAKCPFREEFAEYLIIHIYVLYQNTITLIKVSVIDLFQELSKVKLLYNKLGPHY